MTYREPQFPFSFEIIQKKHSGFFRYLLIAILGLLMIGLISFFLLIKPPKSFIPDTIITVYPGMLPKDLAQVLESQNIVQSGQLFRLLLSTRINQKPIVVGDYIFEKPENIFSALYRINRGIYGNGRIRVTFPEGITVRQMAEILTTNIPDFNAGEFILLAEPQEGYLFPNTYFFFRTSTPEQVVRSMTQEHERFKNRLNEFFDENGVTKESLYGKKRTWQDVIIMASILEREAKNETEAKTIAGILWKRIQINMPLQVDATFLYTIGKGSSQLTLADLRSDGPYNTYTRTGLPIGPIGNPGRAMIEAALNPVSSPYLFYLHDANGKIHYGKNHDEHVSNKNRYLR
jgi:UPF0755 protein